MKKREKKEHYQESRLLNKNWGKNQNIRDSSLFVGMYFKFYILVSFSILKWSIPYFDSLPSQNCGGMSKESKDECNIQVAVRFRYFWFWIGLFYVENRPFSKDEKSYNGNPPFKCNRYTNEVTTTPLKGESVTYDFDNVFWILSSEFFDHMLLYQILNRSLLHLQSKKKSSTK